ncbi:MAG: SPOR domain-containing protein [Bacteroidia bacterium]|nr:SPOR domain-containing protein [Bacteroidia bacterium]
MAHSSINPSTAAFLLRGLSALPILRIGELGSFVRMEQPARWDPDSGIIYPPTIALDFNKGFPTQYDFESYLIDKEGIPTDLAKELAYKLQEQIVSELTEKGMFDIPGLGKLTRTSSGEFSFHTDEQALQVLDNQSFGLKKVQANRHKSIEGTPTIPVKKHEMNTLSKEKITPKDRLLGWKFFLVIALLGALGFLIAKYSPLGFGDPSSTMVKADPSTMEMPVTSDDENSSTGISSDEDPTLARRISELENAASDSPISDQEAAPLIDSSTSEPIASSQANTRGGIPANSNPMADNSPVGDMGVFRSGESGESASRMLAPIQNYHLIAGSFNNVARAQEFVSQLKTEGYDAIILFAEDGSGEPHRVSIYRDSDRQKVSAYAEKLKQMGRQAGWVYAERSY